MAQYVYVSCCDVTIANCISTSSIAYHVLTLVKDLQLLETADDATFLRSQLSMIASIWKQYGLIAGLLQFSSFCRM
jgi:hypothetical protein